MSATNRSDVRKSRDNYSTPGYCVEKLLPYIDFRPPIKFFEPCKGSGAIYDRIPIPEEHKTYCELNEGLDYLAYIPPYKDDNITRLIITNPPFSLALEFLEKSLSEADLIIYLLRLNFLGSVKRKAFWCRNPSSNLFVITPRPSFTLKGTDACEYAWFCWNNNWLDPKFSRIKTRNLITIL